MSMKRRHLALAGAAALAAAQLTPSTAQAQGSAQYRTVELACIAAFQRVYPRLSAQARVQLTMPDIDAQHAGSTVLQQAAGRLDHIA